MILTTPPIIPFENFKWRWASVAPTEGLNHPEVFIGALRAFRKFEGHAPSDPGLITELTRVQSETRTNVDLVRTAERNLIRNSGQYWKAFGLLESSTGVIALTPFGRAVADGKITMAEFAATVISVLELPNKLVQSDTDQWDAFGIRFRPLDLLLRVLERLGELDARSSYIKLDELVTIVEPISAVSSSVDDIVDTLLAYRRNQISLINWPNCAPKANDRRMANEFLLFLEHHGYVYRPYISATQSDKFHLQLRDYNSLRLPSGVSNRGEFLRVADEITRTGVADLVERQRIVREVETISRPNQARFRRLVMEKSRGRCVITGTTLEDALEAAHIIPVKNGGGDSAGNGFCMRSDIHTLYDRGHLRISPDGNLHLSNSARSDSVYGALGGILSIPPYVEARNVDWRWNYV